MLLVTHSPYPRYDRVLQLETTAETSANISFGDLAGDGKLDIVLAKGRHRPLVDRVLLGDGTGGIRSAYDLGTASDRSYSATLADLDGDGRPDIIVANRGEPGKTSNYVCLNRGSGTFDADCMPVAAHSATTIATADIDNDGKVDLIVPHRDGGQSCVYLNGTRPVCVAGR